MGIEWDKLKIPEHIQSNLMYEVFSFGQIRFKMISTRMIVDSWNTFHIFAFRIKWFEIYLKAYI